VALAHLLAEDRFPPDELWAQQLVSSRLLKCEIWNRINAQRLQNSHGEAARNLIGRVAMIEMVGPVLARALQPFPVPVRTLDAIHLSAIEFIRARSKAFSLPVATNAYLWQRASSGSRNGVQIGEILQPGR
jgi:hypothetical protein